jgi:hypothetical protein
MEQLEKAFAIRVDEGVIGEHLADVYVALQLPKKAVAVYQQALKSGGEKEFVARVELKLKNVLEAQLAKASGREPLPMRGANSMVRGTTASEREPASSR